MQTTLEQAIAERDRAIDAVVETSGEVFQHLAKAYIIEYLRRHGPTPGEDLTDKCLEIGIVPHNTKAFGGVFLCLSKRGIIYKVDTCLRRKGHATSGGNVWGLVEREGGHVRTEV